MTTGIWRVVEPTIQAGETYPLARDLTKADALAYSALIGARGARCRSGRRDRGDLIICAPTIREAAPDVANCGYIVAPSATGRGIARAMCMRTRSSRAGALGFRAMQFNFVIGSNERAVRLWQSCGFHIVGRLPDAFEHPRLGLVDALVMYRS